MNGLGSLQALPVWGLVALGALVVVQVVLDVVAFIDLYKRPVEELTIANKWVWVAIILLVSTLGAIIYLLAGHRPAPVAEVASPVAAASRGEAAADALYGARKDSEVR